MNIQESLGPEWWELLGPEFSKSYMEQIGVRLGQYSSRPELLCPRLENIFNAYRLTPPSKAKVIILGQDPYPNAGQAMGLSFSTANGSKPRSLDMIFKELNRSGYTRHNTNLTDWAEQGVMMLNTVLTTNLNMAFAHKDWGWQLFTSETIRQLINYRVQQEKPLVIITWGNPARDVIDNLGHSAMLSSTYVRWIRGCHPVARGSFNTFLGCDHFNTANRLLTEMWETPIQWQDVKTNIEPMASEELPPVQADS